MGFRHVVLALLLLVLTMSAAARAQDFDPRSRHRVPAPVHPPAATGKRPAGATDGAGEARRDPTVLAERYVRVVLSQPGAPFPLQRLAQLYRDRDGNIDKLTMDFERRAAQTGPEQYAAVVTLAGIYKMEGRTPEAVAAYESAIALKPNDAVAIVALARLHQDRGDLAAARSRYEQALPHQTVQADKEQTLRTLMALALDQKDWDGAKRVHRELTGMEPTSLFVRGELARELYNRGEYERAAVELKDLVAAASGDNRALAPALKELGRAQAKAHKNAEALATLKRALSTAGAQSALRTEIYQIVTEVYRAEQQLPALVKQLEDEHPGDAARLAMLGGLYEETGDSAKAIESYRRALGLEPRQADLRLRMIRLLQANGDLEKAILEYEALVHSAPNNPQFVFEECEALLQRGDRVRALKLVSELEARAAGDEEVLSHVADFYGRIGEGERSLRVLQRLAQGAGGDAGHLVDLGDRYLQDGNAALAVQTWKRILAVVQPRARALSALGDVYLEHDMPADALAAYKEATQLEPANLAYKKALAAAYERTHAYRDARALYEEISAKGAETGDRALVRECRSRIVGLWGLERLLEPQLPALKARFAATPPDMEAGRTLAEAQLHLRRLPDAEVTLRRVIALAPGDAESYQALERVLVQESKIAEAIGALETLAQVEPRRARELYERMAQYALQIYKDDDAIRYAARAVELNPDDAEAHRRLGGMYRSRQDVEHAIAELRAAIAKNDRLFVVYFELADLLVAKGQPDEADRLFRRVVRGAPDDELVARAARLSMQINLGNGTLDALEQDLLPLAVGNPQRPVYRRLLVEIYGSLTFGLVQRARHGGTSDADEARSALARIGARAVKPLLDALADSDVSQQRIAIDVLAYVQNRNAALPLFAYAVGPAEVSLRTRAMIACGALADASLTPRYGELLFPRDANGEQAGLSDTVAVAAVWGVARIHDRTALPLLRRIARTGTPAMRALAALGLGLARDKDSTSDVVALMSSPDAGNLPRAAAAYALADLGARSEAPALLEIAETGDSFPRRMALIALARMASSSSASGREPPWAAEAIHVMADAVFAGAPEGGRARSASVAVTMTAAVAMAMIATGGVGSGKAGAAPVDALGVPDGALDVEAVLDALVPQELSDDGRHATLVRYAEPLQRAALAALRTSGARALAVLDAFGGGDGELAPFVRRGEGGPAADTARAILKALEPSLFALAHHPDPGLRTKAIALAAGSSSEGAVDAVLGGIEDPNEAVQRVALAAIAAKRHDDAAPRVISRAVSAVARVLDSDERWALRVLAARAMGRLGAAGGGADASRELVAVATKDPYALVREAALESLASFDRPAATTLAARMATTEPEPRVRDTAKAVAAGETLVGE